MCGRYTLFDEQDNTEIQSIIDEVNRMYPETPIRTGDIFPTNTMPIVVSNRGRILPTPSVWGFPKYNASGVIINARAETAAVKKTFSDCLFHRRCIIPSTGFYEWDKEKRKFLFRMPQEKTLYMAGLYRDYGAERRCVILTTCANDYMKDVHDRMPVIIPKDFLHSWLCDTNEAVKYLSADMPALYKTEIV